ncbi:hypothetical protein CDAR_421481 [Caerostris darwini]|uniref:Uncharacterized protein n=1 Tax=Caerostris darwini TaxID=1538125 RepID=A0AAV4SWU6_9ARAC|nr:hypothetical protein CDAR_421481 [Caerostris darwini]
MGYAEYYSAFQWNMLSVNRHYDGICSLLLRITMGYAEYYSAFQWNMLSVNRHYDAPAPFDPLLPPPVNGERKSIAMSVAAVHPPVFVLDGRSCGISPSGGSENHPFLFPRRTTRCVEQSRTLCSSDSYLLAESAPAPFDPLLPPPVNGERKSIAMSVAAVHPPVFVLDGRSCGISPSGGSENHPFLFPRRTTRCVEQSRIILPLIFSSSVPIPNIAPSGHCAQVTSIYSLNQLHPVRSMATTPRKRGKKIHCSVSGCCASAGVCIGWTSCGIILSGESENRPFLFPRCTTRCVEQSRF